MKLRALLPSLLLVLAPLQAATIWATGSPGITTLDFTRPAFQPGVQDIIGANLTLARGNTQGLYNAALATQYDQGINTQPTNSRWAFASLNGNPAAVSANNLGALTFDTWFNSLNGSAGNNILSRPAVVHIVDEDIYFEVTFTDWGTGGGAGGSFAYTRTAPIPEPSSTLLLTATLPLLLRRRRR